MHFWSKKADAMVLPPGNFFPIPVLQNEKKFPGGVGYTTTVILETKNNCRWKSYYLVYIVLLVYKDIDLQSNMDHSSTHICISILESSQMAGGHKYTQHIRHFLYKSCQPNNLYRLWYKRKCGHLQDFLACQP